MKTACIAWSGVPASQKDTYSGEKQPAAGVCMKLEAVEKFLRKPRHRYLFDLRTYIHLYTYEVSVPANTIIIDGCVLPRMKKVQKILSLALVLLLVTSAVVPAVSAAGGKDDSYRPLPAGVKLTTEPINGACNFVTSNVPVQFADGSYGIITCGHDLWEGAVIYQPTYAPGNRVGFVAKKYSDGIDAALIKLDSGIQSVSKIHGKALNVYDDLIDLNDYGSKDKSKKFKLCGVSSGNIDNLVFYRDDWGIRTPPGCDPLEEYTISPGNGFICIGRAQHGDSGAPVIQNYDIPGHLPDWGNKVVGIMSGMSYDKEKGDTIQVQDIMAVISQLENDGYKIKVLIT